MGDAVWSDALCVEEDPTLSRLVKFGEKDTLPLAKQYLTVNDRNRHGGLAGEELADMRLAVDELVFLEVFGAKLVIIVLVVLVGRNERFNNPAKVVEESSL